MSRPLVYILLALGSYLLGSISFSIAISAGKFRKDIRTMGSGNAGATNMARIYGMAAGVVTMLLDMGKALVATAVGNYLLGDVGVAVAGLSCMIGHCFPVYYRFKGGKGISVGVGLAIAIDWRVLLVTAIVFFAAALSSKKVSLGSICAAVSITVTSVIFAVGAPKITLAACAMVLALFQHRSNIHRLLNGTEPDFKAAHTK